MTDAEQIEAWHIEFEKLDGLTNKDRCKELDRYFNSSDEVKWQGFLMAKRSQLVIELKRPRSIDCSTLNNSLHINYYSECGIHDAITAAGYKYKVKE